MQRTRGRAWRWLRRGGLGVVGLIALAVLGVLGVMHVSPGRELVRRLVEDQLAATFTGGASLGGVEGSPFTQLVLHDLVIRGPDGEPAISAKRLTVELGLLPLLSHQARVGAVLAEDLDVDLRRDASGELQILRLTKPGPSSGWSVALPRLELRQAHVRFDTGREKLNFDDLRIDATADLPHGGPIDATLDLHGRWRERAAAPLALQVVIHKDERGLAVPSLSARAGEVLLTGSHVTVVPGSQGRAPAIGGTASVVAPAAAVARLIPAVVLPADLAFTVTATPVAEQAWTKLAITGKVGQAELRLTGAADLTAKHARGELETGALDLTALTRGALDGSAAAHVAFDVLPGSAGQLPTATATIRGWASLGDLPTTTFDLEVHAAGERAEATVDATGQGVHAKLTARVRVAGDVLAIEHAELHATTSDPAKASGGSAPVHGALEADLTASGQLRPSPSLSVAGTIDGRRLRMKDLSVASLHVAVDAKALPNRPYGAAHVQLTELVRGDLQLGALNLDAADRADGKIAVTVRSRPVQNPWLIELDALVTPPGVPAAGTRSTSGSLVVDLLRHRVRAGAGADWTGRTGHIEISPARIAVRDLTSASPDGRIALAARYERAGRRAGDLAASVDVRSLSLDNIAKIYHGKLDGHVAVARQGGAWQGDVAIDAVSVSIDAAPTPGTTAAAASRASGTPLGAAIAAASAGAGASWLAASLGAAIAPSIAGSAVRAAPPPGALRLVLDTHARATLRDRELAVTLDAASRGVGDVRLALALDAPAELTDAKAWQRRGRTAIRSGRLTLREVQLGRLAELAGLERGYAGRLDGDLQLTSTTASGRIAAVQVIVPRLRGASGIDVVLDVSQPAPNAVTAKLGASLAGIGQVTAQVELATPDRLLDPAAWAQLGPSALQRASVRAANVAIDPAMLDRFGVVSDLRGTVSLAAEVGPGAGTLKASIEVAQLRGGLLVQPVDLRIAAESGARDTTAQLTLGTKDGALVDLQAHVPVAMMALVQQLRDDPGAARQTELAARATLASVDAARILAVFGKTEITAGQIAGDVELAGTFGAPTAVARLTATGLKVPPGPRGKPIKSVDKLALVARWDGHQATLDLDAAEAEGGVLKIAAVVDPGALAAGRVTVEATRFDLIPLLVFVPGPGGSSSGQLDAHLTLNGLDLRTTQIAGEAHLTNARLPIAATVGTLRQAKIDAVIANHEVQLKVDGKLGGGSVLVEGSIALDGAAPRGGKAKLTLRKVSPIGAIEPTISADVTASLARDGDQWKAELQIDHGFVVVPSDRHEPLKPVGMPDDMAFAGGAGRAREPRPQAAPANPSFVVAITLHSTQIESSEFRGNIQGRLELRAGGAALGLFGGIDADRGDLDLFGRRYSVERAGVRFDGSLDPLLDVRISHDFSEVTTVTQVRGRVSKPELSLSSDPGTYSQSELLGFLLGGDPAGDARGAAGSDRVADAGASLVANKIGGFVRDALPIDIDVLRYEAATAATSAAVTVGTWITHSLFLAYRQHLDARPDENTGEGEVEYWLSRRVMLQGTVGNRSYNGLDLLWRKRY